MAVFFINNSEKIRELLKSFGFTPFSYDTTKYALLKLDFEAMDYCGLYSKSPICVRVYPEQIAGMILLGSDDLRQLYVENYNK